MKETEDKHQINVGQWLKHNSNYILISIGIIIIILLPYFLLLGHFESEFTASAAQAATAIAGFTLPLIGIFAVIFLFIIMQQQIKFNKRLVKRDNESLDYSILFSLQSQMKEQVDSITFAYGNKELKGKAVLNLFSNTTDSTVVTLNESDAMLYDKITVIATLGNALLKRNFESNLSIESKYIFYNNTCDTLEMIKSAYVRYYANIEQKSLFDHITRMLVFMPSYKTIKASEVAINFAMQEYNINLRNAVLKK